MTEPFAGADPFRDRPDALILAVGHRRPAGTDESGRIDLPIEEASWCS